jgi:hypothetical protein
MIKALHAKGCTNNLSPGSLRFPALVQLLTSDQHAVIELEVGLVLAVPVRTTARV